MFTGKSWRAHWYFWWFSSLSIPPERLNAYRNPSLIRSGTIQSRNHCHIRCWDRISLYLSPHQGRLFIELNYNSYVFNISCSLCFSHHLFITWLIWCMPLFKYRSYVFFERLYIILTWPSFIISEDIRCASLACFIDDPVNMALHDLLLMTLNWGIQ